MGNVIPEGKGSRVTLHDVARDTGLSVSTVSRALRDTRRVAPDLAELVKNSASRLGYRANINARALRTSSTQTVGMVVPDILNPFFPAIVDSVETVLAAANISLFLCTARGDARVEARRVDSLLEHNVDGILISPVDKDLSTSTVQRAAAVTAVVQLDRSTGAATDRVRVDQAAGIASVLDHVTSLGARSFAYVGGQARSSISVERQDAYEFEIRSRELSPDGPILLGELTSTWGDRAASQLLDDPRGLPDAIVCENDLIAAGVISRLQNAGVQIPSDVLVTGFDDIISAGAPLRIPSVRQPLEELGVEAVRLLLSADKTRSPSPRSVTLEPRLTVG